MKPNNNDSREAILMRLRASGREPVGLPTVPLFEISGDPLANFTAKLESFDGVARSFSSRAEAMAWLRGAIGPERKIYSSVSDFEGNVADSDVADPHRAAMVDVCVAQGEMGVGETGSVWVTEASLGRSACALMATDLYLLLDSRRIVDGLHTAYSLIDMRSSCYGSFFTGPSATADIEAVRVTGAQGPVSLTVLIY